MMKILRHFNRATFLWYNVKMQDATQLLARKQHCQQIIKLKIQALILYNLCVEG